MVLKNLLTLTFRTVQNLSPTYHSRLTNSGVDDVPLSYNSKPRVLKVKPLGQHYLGLNRDSDFASKALGVRPGNLNCDKPSKRE